MACENERRKLHPILLNNATRLSLKTNRQSVTIPLVIHPICAYIVYMTNNPYITQIKQQGKDPVNKPAVIDGFPKTIHGRLFQTKEDYLNALHDFLNGN